MLIQVEGFGVQVYEVSGSIKTGVKPSSVCPNGRVPLLCNMCHAVYPAHELPKGTGHRHLRTQIARRRLRYLFMDWEPHYMN